MKMKNIKNTLALEKKEDNPMIEINELADKYRINVNRQKKILKNERYQTTEIYSNNAFGDYKKRQFLLNQGKLD